MIKEHFKKHKVRYSCIATGVVVAGITTIIMRSVALQHIGVSIGEPAGGAIGVAGKNVVMNNVSLISSNRKGSPGWVVRCIETGLVFTSQKKAAIGMNLSQAHLSNHLNGVRDNVSGYHFERICMAA